MQTLLAFLTRSSRALAFLFALAFVALLAGCGPHWVVIKQATPNPMSPSSRFYVDKVNLQGLRVGDKTEAEWMADKSPDTREKWEGDKAAMGEAFLAGFARGGEGLAVGTSPAEGFTVRAHFVHYEPGFYAGIVSGTASIEATIEIVDPSGNVVDAFQIQAGAGGMSAGERARICAQQLGAIAGRYVVARVHG